MNPSVFYVKPKSGFLAFGRVVRSVQTHYREIMAQRKYLVGKF